MSDLIIDNKIDTAHIERLLVSKYCRPHWISFTELRFGTGYSIARAIDMFAISPYAKNGYGYSMAFEIKISRADFMHEITDPEKRSFFVGNSNQFYYVTPTGLLNENEIPAECGLMECGLKKIVIKRIAQQRMDIEYSPLFLASICNRITGLLADKEKRFFNYMGKQMTKKDLEELLAQEKWEMEHRIRKEVRDEFKAENDENLKALEAYRTKTKEITGGYCFNDNDRINKLEQKIIELKGKKGITDSDAQDMNNRLCQMEQNIAFMKDALGIKLIKRGGENNE